MVYSTKLGQQICERTASSSIGLRHICKELGVAYTTVTNWIYDEDHELHAKYAHAKLMQLHHLAEEILEIADDSSNDYMTVVGKNGKTKQVLNREAISRSNLRIRARQVLIAKLSPILRTGKIKPKEEPTRRIILEKWFPDELPAKEYNSSSNSQYDKPGTSPANQGQTSLSSDAELKDRGAPENPKNIGGSSPKTTPAGQRKTSKLKNVKNAKIKNNPRRKTQKKVCGSSPKNARPRPPKQQQRRQPDWI